MGFVQFAVLKIGKIEGLRKENLEEDWKNAKMSLTKIYPKIQFPERLFFQRRKKVIVDGCTTVIYKRDWMGVSLGGKSTLQKCKNAFVHFHL